MVKLEMEVAGIPDRETEMMNPDFTKIAEAKWNAGYYLSEPDEVIQD